MSARFLKKYLLPILLTISLVSGFSGQAQESVFVTGGTVNTIEQNPIMTNAAAANIGDFNQNLFEWGQTFVLETLKKRILDMIVDQIIQWVQGGGEPKFITDWEGFLRDAGQAAAGDFVEELGLGFLCQPFSAQIRIALQNPGRFSQRASCTLDRIVGNIENFYENFENGGWIAFTESMKPQNNYYGALLMSIEEKERRVGAAQWAAQNEGLAGGGFKSTRNESGDITTPGSVIGATVSKAIGSDIDYIVNADQLQEYVAAISNAIINRLIREGINGLQGVDTDNAPRGGSVPASQTRQACNGLTGSALESCLRYSQATSDSFTASRNTILDQIDLTLLPRAAAQNLLNNLINDLYRFGSTTTEIYDELITLEKKENASPVLCAKPKNQLLQEIAAAISLENGRLIGLQSQASTNQLIIDELVAAKNRILLIAQDDWSGLNTISNSIQGRLNPAAAESFKQSIEESRSQIRSELARYLSAFNLEIARCYE